MFACFVCALFDFCARKFLMKSGKTWDIFSNRTYYVVSYQILDDVWCLWHIIIGISNPYKFMGFEDIWYSHVYHKSIKLYTSFLNFTSFYFRALAELVQSDSYMCGNLSSQWVIRPCHNFPQTWNFNHYSCCCTYNTFPFWKHWTHVHTQTH